jgi:hypothetical protein
MKMLICSMLLALSFNALAVTDLPGCTLEATYENELPFDVAVQVTKKNQQFFLKFAKRSVPVSYQVETDMKVIEYTLGYLGSKVPRGTKSMDYYEYATSENQVILYVVKSANKTLAKFLLIDGVGGACK